MGGISVTPDRAARASYSDTYLQDGKAPITTCADAGRFQTLSQIDQPGVRVVVNPGGTNESYDRQMLKRATIVTFPDNNTIFDELLDGHDDLDADRCERGSVASRPAPRSALRGELRPPIHRGTQSVSSPAGGERFSAMGEPLASIVPAQGHLSALQSTLDWLR